MSKCALLYCCNGKEESGHNDKKAMTQPHNTKPDHESGADELRRKLVEIWGLEEAPDGEQDMMLTRDYDDAVIEGVSYAEEINLTMALIADRERAVRIDELEALKQYTLVTSHPDAFVTDTGIAQGIRIHTNSLIEYRLAELRSQEKA